MNFIFIFSLFLSAILTYLVKIWMKSRSILDRPNNRSSHSVPTPRGGGIAITIAWFFAITFLFFTENFDYKLYFTFLCGVPIAVIGLVDDVFTISPKVRLFIQVVSSTFAIISLGGVGRIDLGFFSIQSSLFISIIAIVGLVWFINFFNFLDGIDGYVSVEVIYIGIAFFLLYGQKLPLLLATVTAGFLIWNWQPAKIFMGDVGSTLLGFTIGVFALYYPINGNSTIITWLMLTSLFWFDASLTLYRRWRNGETLSNAHKKHAYQRIVQSGFSHQRTVIFSLLINIFIVSLLVLLVKIYPSYSLLFFLVNIVFLYIVVKMVDKRFPFPK